MKTEEKLLPEKISPEGLTIAETYLTNQQDANLVATKLNMPVAEVRRYLNTPEVRGYINQAFMESGFRNRERMFGVMDELINRKLKELEETDLSSSLDIMDVMTKYHRMKMDELKMEQALLESKAKIQNQNNIQINDNGGGNYTKLLEKLIK